MIKLLAIDLDGTLLNSNRQISSKNLDYLHQAEAADVKIVLCTGRPYLAMKQFVHEIGFTSPDDYIITFNGGQTQKAADGQVIDADTLSRTDMQLWWQELNRLDLPMNVIDSHYVYEPLAYPAGFPSLYVADGVASPLKTKDYNSFDDSSRFNKFVVGTDASHLQAQQQVIDRFLLSRYSLTFSYPWLMEISNRGVHKGQAVKNLADRLDIDQSQVMAIGDQLNDLTMIQYAGMGVAMANADERVKQAADCITASNDDDGVALAIQDYILKAKPLDKDFFSGR